MTRQLRRTAVCWLSALAAIYSNLASADSKWEVKVTPICVQEDWQQHPNIYEDRIIWKDFRSG